MNVIHEGAVIYEGVVIGDGCKIQTGAMLFDGVVLEDDVFIGPGVCFTNVRSPRAFEKAKSFEKTIVRRGAAIGANATILCGIEIGEYAMIGAGSVVTKNVKAYTTVVGNPARIIK